MEFSRPEYWSGWPFLSPGDLPNPGFVGNEFYFLVKAPFLVDLKKPELKIPHTVNFYIKVEPGVILGIW